MSRKKANKYGHDFYRERHRKTINSASTILSMVFDALPTIHSAVDFGCGVGTWLSVLKEKGVEEIQGFDGPWVEEDLLEIPRQDFRQVNFEEEVKLDRRFDLAISLEVAEHVSPENASRFVENLTNASDFVLFSAAIPFQGGVGHVNEQWPEYWADLFGDKGYVLLDFIRMKIWNDDKVLAWYRQNILMFVKQEQMQNVNLPAYYVNCREFPANLVHPETLLSKARKMYTVSGAWLLYRRAVKKWIKRKMGKKV